MVARGARPTHALTFPCRWWPVYCGMHLIVIILLILWVPLVANAQGVPVEVGEPIVPDSAAATAPSVLVASQAQAEQPPRLDMTPGQGEIPWSCPYCSYDFVRPGHFLLHLQPLDIVGLSVPRFATAGSSA